MSNKIFNDHIMCHRQDTVDICVNVDVCENRNTIDIFTTDSDLDATTICLTENETEKLIALLQAALNAYKTTNHTDDSNDDDEDDDNACDTCKCATCNYMPCGHCHDTCQKSKKPQPVVTCTNYK